MEYMRIITKTKYKTMIFMAMLICNVCSLYARPEYPSVAYGKPKCFEQNNNHSYRWEQIVEDRDFGELTSNPWVVYVCNEGATVYEEPRLTSRILTKDIHFMEDFYVADLTDGFALLFYYDSKLEGDNGLEIPSQIISKKSIFKQNRRTNGYIGWVSLDDLLLWDITPKTKEGIFQKITVVKNVQVASNFKSMPQLFMDEECTIIGENPQTLNALDFYFTFKKSETGNALVYANYQLDGRMLNKKVGWIKVGEFIDWNTRICWEPAFGEDINEYAYTFSSEEAAFDKKLKEKVSSAKLSAKRFSTQYEPRSPVVIYNADNAIALLSVLANQKGQDLNYQEVQKKIDDMKKSLSKINIVFVMDATNSMKSCFNAMSNAVQQIGNYRYTSNNVRFGAVVYRNYQDAPENLVESISLTDDFSKIKDFLSSVKCFSVSKRPQEAMFYGLNYAVDNMDWNSEESNFIVLVSDVSSKSPDERGFTTESVSKKLAYKGVNLVAFQARSQPEAVYQNFGDQVCDIIELTLNKLDYKDNSVSYESEPQIFYYNKDVTDKWPLRYMGYKFKESDEQNINASELTAMATGIIKEFILTTQANIDKLSKSISSTEIDSSICEALIRKGVIENCDDLKGMIRISGYTRRIWTQGKRMFVPCVFLADKELNDLIRDLEQATKGTVINLRLELQKVFKRLILSYTGQQLTAADLSSNFSKIINSIEIECGYQFDINVKKHMTNPNLLSDNEIQQLVRRLSNSINVLKKKQNDASTYKDQDGNKYYYLLLEDMPLVTRQ